MVRNDSPLHSNDEVDQPGNRVTVGAGSAYDLFLTRHLKNAPIVRAPSSPAVVDVFMAQQLEVAAGVKQQLQADAQRLPGVRLLPALHGDSPGHGHASAAQRPSPRASECVCRRSQATGVGGAGLCHAPYSGSCCGTAWLSRTRLISPRSSDKLGADF